MARVALKLVEAPIHEEREVNLWPREDDDRGHSLHYLVSYPVSFPWSLPHFFIHKFTQKGDIVLDPFCGSGTTLLEAGLSGRVAYGVDSDPLAVRIASAKLSPADITEVTLKVQDLNFSRPAVLLGRFQEFFSPFFDVATFRELLGLKQYLETYRENPLSQKDNTLNFVEALAISLLHGHSAGYLSTYTYPQIAISPQEQYDLNLKRRQRPDYRAVAPRLLRKAAIVTSDGVPVALRMRPSLHKVACADPRDLGFVDTGSVSLTMTSVPYPGMRDLRQEQWLKVWFSGLEGQSAWHPSFDSLENWSDYMNEVLLELARVTKPGGRAVLDTREISIDGMPVCLDRELLQLVDSELGRYWMPDVTLLQYADSKKTSIGTQTSQALQGRDYRVVVLRRR